MRYLFHVYDDLVTLDEEGVELPTIGAARDHAFFAARELIGHQARAGSIDLSHRIEIKGEGDGNSGTVWFRDVARVVA